MIIAIDGPSGAGKSTIGKMLAKELGLLYLDTGAMYRAVAYSVLRQQIPLSDSVRVIEIAENSAIDLSGEPEHLHIFLNDEDVSPNIRTNDVGQAASIVSSISEVRKILVKRQQELGNRGAGCVLDGRDIGSVVFPNADVKFYLTAAAEARAKRRYEEDKARGVNLSYDETLAEINARDKRDVTRADSPLTIAEGAVVIDTSEMNTTEALAKMLSVVAEKTARKSVI